MPTTRTLPRGRGSSPLPLLLSTVEPFRRHRQRAHIREERSSLPCVFIEHITPRGNIGKALSTLLLSSTVSSFVAPSLPYHHICIIHPRVTKLSSSTIRPYAIQSILRKSTPSLSILLHTHTRTSFLLYMLRYTFCMYQQHPTPPTKCYCDNKSCQQIRALRTRRKAM